MSELKETIAAIATPPGDGGVAIIRVSGSKAYEMVNELCSKNLLSFKTHQFYLASCLNEDQSVLDQAMFVVMKGPHSYTGEDVVEIHGHGGHFLSKKILQRVLNLGAKIANPGEFTERAFLNGKLDLAQAEAVQKLIGAKNEFALKSAAAQLSGRLSSKIKKMQQQLVDQAAIIEAWVDFPEEGLEFTTFDRITETLVSIQNEMQQLIDTYEDGRVLQEGFSLCLAGKPNVGKSSLMNLLLKKERALVTSIPGTTRDILEEGLKIEGIAYRLMDTAGIRDTEELVEKLGIERATQMREIADLILLVLDASEPLSQEDLNLIEKLKEKKVLVLWNKCDQRLSILPTLPFDQVLEVSARTGQGADQIYRRISKLLMGALNLTEEIHLTELRHKKALEEGAAYLAEVLKALQENTSPEWITFDLKSCLKALSSIIGFDITENILSSIFSNFCVGK